MEEMRKLNVVNDKTPNKSDDVVTRYGTFFTKVIADDSGRSNTILDLNKMCKISANFSEYLKYNWNAVYVDVFEENYDLIFVYELALESYIQQIDNDTVSLNAMCCDF